MLSRIAAKSAQLTKPMVARPMVVAIQKASYKEGPERDLVNFPRPVLREHPGAVRLGFIPEEWFDFFYKKTGVSGPYMFGIGLTTFLCSKEIYVLEHEFYNSLSLLIVIVAAHHYLGPSIAKALDKQVDEHESMLRESEDNAKKQLVELIEEEKQSQWQMEGIKQIFDAKRENVALQLEAAYRERLYNAYTEVKRRLDYQLELLEVERRISQKNMASWVTENVLKSISATQEQETLKKCISDLKSLSALA